MIIVWDMVCGLWCLLDGGGVLGMFVVYSVGVWVVVLLGVFGFFLRIVLRWLFLFCVCGVGRGWCVWLVKVVVFGVRVVVVGLRRSFYCFFCVVIDVLGLVVKVFGDFLKVRLLELLELLELWCYFYVCLMCYDFCMCM